MSTWSMYCFTDWVAKRAVEVERRKEWAAVYYAPGDDRRKKLLAQFALVANGTALPDMKPTELAKGMVFLHRQGRYALVWTDGTTEIFKDLSANGARVFDVTGHAAISAEIDKSGDWMRVADSPKEWVEMMVEKGTLGTTDEVRAAFAKKTG